VRTFFPLEDLEYFREDLLLQVRITFTDQTIAGLSDSELIDAGYRKETDCWKMES
jgi:hypothetical protein